MSKPKPALPWYKWWPRKAFSSAEWLTLTLEQEGYYRRLYDLASLSTPASKRGWLYQNGHPMSPEEIHLSLRVGQSLGAVLLNQLVLRGLIVRNSSGAYGFPDYAKHQRTSNLRPRPDRKKPGQKRDKSGAELEHKTSLEERGKRREVRGKKKEHTDSLSSADLENQVDAEAAAERSQGQDPEPSWWTPDDFAQMDTLCMKAFGSTPSAVVSQWADVYEARHVRAAILVTQAAGKRHSAYTRGILQRWAKEGWPELGADGMPVSTGGGGGMEGFDELLEKGGE